MFFRSKKSAEPKNVPEVQAISQIGATASLDPVTAQTPTHSADTMENRFAVSFAHVVMKLMRAPQYKLLPLADLELLVMPALRSNQCAVLESTDEISPETGAPLVRAIALWATVSADVDLRLQHDTGPTLQLALNEWRSGEIVWLIDAVGDEPAIQQLVGYLRHAAFKGRDLKLRSRTVDGAWQVGVLPQ